MATFFDPNTASGQQRFWYISGLTSDEFYTDSCLLLNLTQYLFHELREAGYEKIVFYNARKRLYCFDENSYSLLTGKKNEEYQSQASVQPSSSNKSDNRVKGLRKGAWGKKTSSTTSPATTENKSAHTSAQYQYLKPHGNSRLHIGMQDNTAILSQFRGMMTDSSHSTVIVVDNADDFLKSLGQGQGWNNFFKEISELNSTNHNIMIFIFPDIANGSILHQEQMTEDEKQLRRLNNITISAPDALEFYYMLHYYRLNHGLKVNVRDIHEIAYEISRCIAKISQIQTPADGAASGVRIKMLANLLRKWISAKQVLTVSNCYQLFSQYYHIGKIESAQEMLNNLIGMASVKKQIVEKYGSTANPEPRSWMQKCVQSRLKPHLHTKKNNDFYHIVLTGNPGTGKTTVAKLLGQFFAEAGILRIGHVVETDRSGLVAGYVGQTAIKTREQVTQALGGILFIDEAYSISDDENDPFGKECIDTLVKAMDEFKDDLIVVVAGYPDKMKLFLERNPGLMRRFRETIHIPDYSPNELLQILEYHMQRRNLRFSDEMREIMPAFCESWISQADENWGNAGEAVKLAADIETIVNSHRSEIEIGVDSQSGKQYTIISKEQIPDNYQKYFVGIESLRGDAVADIMKMPGLHSVKAKIKEIENALIAGNLQDAGHYVFMGAPGTGKTTIARKMGLLFRTHKLLKRGHCIETSAGELIAKVLHNQGDFIKSVKQALDGVLFIDEAYQLMNRPDGRDIIDSMVKFMEDNRNRVCVILAGYEDEMAEMLRSANPGLESRIKRIHFDNYSGEELFEILETMLPTMGLKADDAFMESAHRALVRYVSTQQKNQHFGNARYVRSVFLEDAKNCMNSRLVNRYGRDIPDDLKNLLTGADIPESLKRFTKQPLPKPDHRTLLDQLHSLIGFATIKEHLHRLLALHQYQETTDTGAKEMPINLNLVLKGNPGTGKTMIAKLIGRVYKECGLLSDGRTFKVDRSDLVGGYVGQTAIKTRNWIEKSMGSVLFIDEAYALTDSGSENDFGQEAVTTLVAAMTDHIGEFSVIVAGYPDKMDQFIRSNQGLNGRFMEFLIDDYSPEELTQIFRGMCNEIKFHIDPALDSKLDALFRGFKSFKSKTEDWQNARECENLVRIMQQNWLSNRVAVEGTDGNKQNMFTTDHIPDELQRFLRIVHNSDESKTLTGLEQIQALEGFEEIKAHFKTLANLVNAAQEPGMDFLLDEVSLHLVLTGNPGTGKTTVARMIAKAYKELGLLRNGNLVEVTDKDLVAGYVGQTSTKTETKIREALGGVLFIDEAYTLVSNGSSFGQDAIGTLLKAMSDLKGQFAVIVAGYQNEMKRFLDANPGLQSRFAKQFHMTDYTDDQLISIFKSKCKQIKALPTQELLDTMTQLLPVLRTEHKSRRIPWANGRVIENIVDSLKEQWANTRETVSQEGQVFLRFTPATLPSQYADLLSKQSTVTQAEDYRMPESAIKSSIEQFTYPTSVPSLEQGVVLIETKRLDGEGYGSGSMLTSDGYILTCSHVIHNADNIRVRLKIAGRTDGEISWHPARIVRDDPDRDCALIKIDVWGYPSLSISPVDYEIHSTDEIFLLGYPFGAQIANSADDLALSFFEGKISSIQQNDEISRVFVNMEAKSGCSGAPVFSQKTGKIIGILCGSQTSKNGSLVEEINYILPMHEIRQSLFK